jgi:phosphate transport system substrate-binding protein
MKPRQWFLLPLLLMALACSCDREDTPVDFHIDGLSLENYPRIDGSTSTEPLQMFLASRLFGIGCSWVYSSYSFRYPFVMAPSCDENPEVCKFLSQHVWHSGTHSAFMNLIYQNAELVLVARTASEDELHAADSLDVGLIETPVALDAFVFLNHISNPVHSLTTQQIRDIYTGQVTRWDQVGGNATEINAFMRERNSGSQELMELLVMKDLAMPEFPEMIVFGMMGLINRIEYEPDGLGYSVHYYTRYMVRSDSARLLAVDGYYPGADEISQRKYPYVTEVYAVIRDDLEHSSMAYRIYELLSTPGGQAVIGESGYIPYH